MNKHFQDCMLQLTLGDTVISTVIYIKSGKVIQCIATILTSQNVFQPLTSQKLALCSTEDISCATQSCSVPPLLQPQLQQLFPLGSPFVTSSPTAHSIVPATYLLTSCPGCELPKCSSKKPQRSQLVPQAQATQTCRPSLPRG